MKFRKKLIIWNTLSLVIIMLIYGLFNARLLLIGPQIIIKTPENGTSFNSPFIEIHGEALNTSFIKMNDRTIYVNENNEFREKLLLPPGTSIIRIDAQDRFERSTEVILWYTYKGDFSEITEPEINIDLSTSSPTSTPSSSSSLN